MNYLFKVNNGNTRKICENLLKANRMNNTDRTPERPLDRFHILFWCSHSRHSTNASGNTLLSTYSTPVTQWRYISIDCFMMIYGASEYFNNGPKLLTENNNFA